MAISYYGTVISPNQIETGEGFLICRNVPLARIGSQTYLADEIGIQKSGVVDVLRTEEEVFSPKAMASFEGKPVTNDHPPDLLDPETVSLYEKGHAQNIRRGTGEWSDYLIGDLHIHDAQLIQDIKNGKREISCGYDVDYEEDEDGTIRQTNIRGNHVAVVESGRAGHKAAIMDSNTSKPKTAERKRKMSKKSTFLKLFGQAANGKSEDELAKMAMDAADALEETEETKVEEKKEETKDEDPMREILDALKMINGRLDALEGKTEEKTEEKIEEKVEEDPFDEALKEVTREVKGGEEAVVVPAEEMDGCGSKDGGTSKSVDTASLLKAIRPAVFAISNEQEKKAVTDALLGAIKTPGDDLKKIMDAAASHQAKKETMDEEAIQNAYAQMNPHTRKEAK